VGTILNILCPRERRVFQSKLGVSSSNQCNLHHSRPTGHLEEKKIKKRVQSFSDTVYSVSGQKWKHRFINSHCKTVPSYCLIKMQPQKYLHLFRLSPLPRKVWICSCLHTHTHTHTQH